jgi:hypothetical protein
MSKNRYCMRGFPENDASMPNKPKFHESDEK